MFRADLFRIAEAGTVVLFLGGGGWALREAWPAYLAVGLAGVYGVFLVAGRPATILRDGLVRVLLAAFLVAVLVASTGGAGSPFFVLYPLAALGVYWIPDTVRAAAGAAAMLGGYLVATVLPAGDLGVLLSAEVGIRAAAIALFCAVGGFMGAELRGARENVRKLSSALEAEHRYEEIEDFLVPGFGPVLSVLSLEGILRWTAETVSGLLGAPYVHAATLEGDHRTAIRGDSEVYPSWWHPKVQQLVLWSYRTGEVLRDESTVHDLKGFMVVPVVSGGEQLAAVVVGGKDFGAEEERALKLLARGVAPALEGAAEAPGGRDPVSGLPNRASLHRVLRRELSASGALTVLAIRLEDPERVATGPAATDALLEELGGKLRDGWSRVYHYGGDEFVAVLRGDDAERARGYARGLKRLVAGLKSDPALPLAASVGFVATGPDGGDPDLTLEAAWSVLREARRRPEKIFGLPAGEAKEPGGGPRVTEAVRALVAAVEVRDPYLAEHSRAVSEIARRIASRMGLSREQTDALTIGALLHDVGKIAIPDAILHKPGPLTAEEYEVIKRHPLLGARILGPLGELSAALPAVRHHHERFDGGGYPDGLRGEEIPLLARVTVVADAFDSMTRYRGYQRGVPAAAALQELERNSGTQFDPAVVAALVRAAEETSDRRSGFAG